MSEKSNRVIAILIMILFVIAMGSCASLIANSSVWGASPVVSPTRRPVRTPTSAPTEPPKPTSPADTENVQFLPLIMNGQAPGHDYPSIENCRIEASPMEDLVDMCCGLYGMLCEYKPTSAPTEYRPTSAPTETPVWKAEPTGWVRPAVTPAPAPDVCQDVKYGEDGIWYYCCKTFGIACHPGG